MRKQPQETIATCMAAAQELDTGCEMASYVAALMPVAAVALLRARCRGTGRMLDRSALVLVSWPVSWNCCEANWAVCRLASIR